MNSKLTNPVSNGPHISGISESQPLDASCNPGSCLHIPQLSQPIGKDSALPNLNHRGIVACKLRILAKHFRHQEKPEKCNILTYGIQRKDWDFMSGLEARVGIEPTHKGFADLSLTTWVPRLWDQRPVQSLYSRPCKAGGRLERETGLEPATLALARRCSTTELLPLEVLFEYIGEPASGQSRRGLRKELASRHTHL